jgi:putative endonuclease
MDRMTGKEIGDRGEAIAARYLEAQGYVILDRNYRYQRAELDLVCYEPAEGESEGGELVFTEVKTRSGLGFGRPEEAVSSAKRRHLVRAARAYLYERRLEGAPCRFDVISIMVRGESEPDIEHFKRAFWA